MMRPTTVLAMLVTLAAVPLGAQGAGRTTDGVPPGHRPPAGMCRIWIEGVPAGQQPAPTDCATAVRNRPSNGRVIFGEQGARTDNDPSSRTSGDDARAGNDRPTSAGKRSGGATGGWRWDALVPRPSNLTGAGGGGGGGDNAQDLPLMSSAVSFSRGQRNADVSRWVGADRVSARLLEVRDGRPQRVEWTDASGQLRQVWFDGNRDGRADRIDIYENGRLVRSLR